MKRSTLFLLLFACLSLTTVSSCKTGEGCNTDQWNAKTDKDGNMSTKRGKSGLFSKKEQKRMKKRGK